MTDIRSFFSQSKTPTYEEVIASKQLPHMSLVKEFYKLRDYKPRPVSRCFTGNPILYHYQLDNLCRVKVNKKSFYETMTDDKLRAFWWERVNHYAPRSRPNQPALRFFEVWRRLNGIVVFFRPTVAMNLYARFHATSVLDPTAGWGGRMLGAMAMGISYTGIDTNVDLKPAYDQMISALGCHCPVKDEEPLMLWQDALYADFSAIDYDFVLTSPPYLNLEVYPHMKPYESKTSYYKSFLIPLLDKCRRHIRRNGKVAFNISPKMYEELLSFGYEPCLEKIPMLQQKVQGKDKGDMVYVW